ncbi:MAG: cupredoxin domain-containing protein [Actinomycetota bacterium]
MLRLTMTRPRRRRIVRGTALAAGFTALTACGSADEETLDGRELQVDLVAVDYAFEANEALEIAVGDRVTFTVRNGGTLDHELEVLSSENRSLGATERIPPNAVREVTVTFEEEGTYRVICDIDDHFSRGQVAQFTVTPPA